MGMAMSGLRATVVGEWEITHPSSPDEVWGRAVVKSLSDAVILIDTVVPCAFSFRQLYRPQIQASSGLPSVVTIRWGESSYATLEALGKDSLTWRLPTQDDGTAGEHTIWRRRLHNSSTPQAADELSEVAEELAEARAKAAVELAELRTKATDELAEVRAKAAEELAGVQAKAAELAEVHSKAAAEMREKVGLSEEFVEAAKLRAKAADELSEARAGVADEIAEENASLRQQLEAQVVRSESLQNQLESVRMVVTEMLAQSMPGTKQASVLKDICLEPITPPKSHTKCIQERGEEAVKHAELPLEKKRRVNTENKEAVKHMKKRRIDTESKDGGRLGRVAMVACGA